MLDTPESIHAAFTTRPDEIVSLAAYATSQPIAQQTKIIGGVDTEVHRITTADSQCLYIHIRRHGELPFSDIAWALEQARAAGALVPEVLWSGQSWVDGGEREVMIQRGIPGRPLKDFADTLSDDELRQCYRQAMPTLTAIHSVPVAGHQMRRSGVWDFPDWPTLEAAWVAEHRASSASFAAVGFSDSEIERLITALERLLQRFPCHQPVLLQGDFTPGHLLFDERMAFTGLLDFGQFQGGSPVLDIDLLLPDKYLGDPTERERLPVAWVRECYGPAAFWDDLEAHQLLYRLYNDLHGPEHFLTKGLIEPLTTMVVPTLRKVLADAEAALGV